VGRTGSAVLPLHYGKIPEWLSSRMARLGAVICEAIVLEYGRDELLRRLSHPHWFQSFGAVMGMDWHSSGITTTVLGALKRGLAPISDELGVFVCGGRGTESRRTPSELALLAEKKSLNGNALIRASRLCAKVDGAAVQDGYQIYLHGFITTLDGKWCVVQQGMSEERREARRYHWLSEGIGSFVDSPHSAIDGVPVGDIVNLADRRAEASRGAQLSLIRGSAAPVLRALDVEKTLPLLVLPDHHEVRKEDVVMRRLAGALAAAQEAGPRDFEDLLLVSGVGPRTMLSLAMAAEIIHGAPCRFSDPARYSLAHGGKDGHPYPVPVKVFDQTIRVLKNAVERSKLGNDDKVFAIKQLDREVRRLEPTAHVPDFDDFVAEEKKHVAEYDGRTVMTHPRTRDAKRSGSKAQLTLFGKRR
jgi:uncharacterized protein